MTCVAQQITGIAQQAATIGQQGRNELATLRYMYRGCSDAYKTLYERHKATAAELECLKNQDVQERTLSEVGDMEEITQLRAKIALVEKELEQSLQDKENVEVGYLQALINAESRIQSQEEELKLLRADKNADLEDPLLSVTHAQSPKRERGTDELPQEEGRTKKSRKRKAKQQK